MRRADPKGPAYHEAAFDDFARLPAQVSGHFRRAQRHAGFTPALEGKAVLGTAEG